jgi:hypothetical protein
MPGHDEKGSFLFSLTLTELAFLLFFILLLLAVAPQFLEDGDPNEPEPSGVGVPPLERNITAEGIEKLDQLGITDDVINTLEQLGITDDVINTLEQLGITDEVVTKINDTEIIEPIIKIVENTNEEWTKLAVGVLSGLLNAEDPKEVVVVTQEPGPDSGYLTADEIQKLISIYWRTDGPPPPELGNGLDHPPCWPHPVTGRPEYIFDVTIREQGIAVAKAWPETRAEDVKGIFGATEFPDTQYSRQQFLQHTSSILEWSQEQTPECRHSVRVYDATNTKDGYKQALQTVEAVFYKYLVPLQ